MVTVGKPTVDPKLLIKAFIEHFQCVRKYFFTLELSILVFYTYWDTVHQYGIRYDVVQHDTMIAQDLT